MKSWSDAMDKKKLAEIASKALDLSQSDNIIEDKLGYGEDNRILTHVKLNDIIVQKQIREQIDREDEEFKSLLESIKKDGVISPVWIKPIDNKKYLLIAGERRYLAAKEAGFYTIPVAILPKDANVLLYQIIENLQRKDLSNYEKAKAFYEFYKETVENKNISPEQIVSQFQENIDSSFLLGLSKIGVSSSVFIRYLKILCFSEDLQNLIKEKNIPVYIVEKLYSYRNNENIADLFNIYLTGGEKVLDNHLQKINKQKSQDKPKEKRYFSTISHVYKTIEKIANENVYVKDKEKIIPTLENLKILIENLLKNLKK
jgi:ParB/RepB/Spo0J family partition protein